METNSNNEDSNNKSFEDPVDKKKFSVDLKPSDRLCKCDQCKQNLAKGDLRVKKIEVILSPKVPL